MTKPIDIIKKNQTEGGQWQAEAEIARKNWAWMRYSMLIAMKVRSTMRDNNITQSTLASKLGCSQQYISLILKGKENLTLETISKLESALGISLIASSFLVTGYQQTHTQRCYLCDSAESDLKSSNK